MVEIQLTNNLYHSASYSATLISDVKTKYLYKFAEKLNEPHIGAKSYWSILNKFMHKKKIPLIPPILINDSFVMDISKKTHLFNTYYFFCKSLYNKKPKLTTIKKNLTSNF